MNTLQVTDTFGELNSTLVNQLPVDAMGGDAVLTLDLIAAGVAFGIVSVVNFPRIKPRITVPAETNVARVRA